MPEETFRPKKKAIDPSEVSDAAANQAKLDDMAEMRARIEGGADDSGPPLQEGGVQISGNIPQAVLDAKQQVQQQRPKQRRKKTKRAAKQPMPAGAQPSALAEVLEKIRSEGTVYEEISLPSTGKFYEDNGPSGGTLHVRPMTGHEEEILATPRFVKKGQAINMIFQRCIEENYNPQELLTQDRTYLLIYLRGISYTPEYDVEIKCPECDTKFATTIDLNSLFVDYCPDDFGLEDLRGTLPKTGLEYTYRLSKGDDEREIQDYRDRRIKNFDVAGQADDTLLYRSAMLVQDIAGVSQTGQILQLLRELPIQDVAHLRNELNEPPFGVDTNVEIICPSCLAEFDIDLPLEANFFFPRGKNKKETPQ